MPPAASPGSNRPCPDCGENFRSNEDLAVHLVKVHLTGGSPKVAEALGRATDSRDVAETAAIVASQRFQGPATTETVRQYERPVRDKMVNSIGSFEYSPQSSKWAVKCAEGLRTPQFDFAVFNVYLAALRKVAAFRTRLGFHLKRITY